MEAYTAVRWIMANSGVTSPTAVWRRVVGVAMFTVALAATPAFGYGSAVQRLSVQARTNGQTVWQYSEK